MNYLEYSEFETATNAIDAGYMWSLLQSVVGSRSLLQTTVENEILSPAESLVNGYVSRVRAVPVLSTSQYFNILKKWTLAIAWYELEKRGLGSNVREKIRLDYEDSMRMLRDVGAGKFPMGDDDGAGPETDVGTSIDFVGDDCDCDNENLGLYY